MYLRSGGAEGGMRGENTVLLLTTTGRKSGKLSTVPLLFFPEGGELMVVASNYGREIVPDWYLNIQANPRVKIQIYLETFDATARTVTPEERPGLWQDLIEVSPFYGNYQANMQREIPLVMLKRD
jgi:deazaflavin-dependent oxidoreductase (nitroreductase family)